MKVLFLTGLYPDDYITKLNELSRGHIQNAPNAFQWAVIDGFKTNNVDFHVISFPFLPTFPLKYRKLFTPSGNIMLDDQCIGKMIPYCSLLVYKPLSIYIRLKPIIRDWIVAAQNDLDQNLIILTYTPSIPVLSAIKDLRKEYPHLQVATIVTDLVDDMMNFKLNRSFLKRIQSHIVMRQTKRLYKHIDKYILLTKDMIEKIPEAKDRHIVIEGIAAPRHLELTEKDNKTVSILYTGTLEKFSGIAQLLLAFHKIKDDSLRLIICGIGELQSMVEDYTKKDYRITYKGMLMHNDVIELQKHATLLINPRRPDMNITRYSFPSKTMEYLLSGTPMIGYRLDGIPHEYFEYFYNIEDLSEGALIKTIQTVASIPCEELRQKGISAYNFIMSQKTSHCQVKKILDFLTS